MHIEPDKKEVNKIKEDIAGIKKEVSKVIVGQEKVLDTFIKGLLCDGI